MKLSVSPSQLIWIKKQLHKTTLAGVQICAGMAPLVLASQRSYYVAAETYIATAAIACAVLFSFVYALSITLVSRYKLKWRNMFSGNCLLTLFIAAASITLLQSEHLRRLLPLVTTSHILAAAFMCMRNMVSPIMVTLNLLRSLFWCELISVILFVFGLLSLPHILKTDEALLGAIILQTVPFLYITAHFIIRHKRFSRPRINISDGISGVFDSLFGSLASNGTRLALVSTPVANQVLALIIFRIGTGVAQLGAQIFFLFVGRRVIKEITGGEGQLYHKVLLWIALILGINFMLAVWATQQQDVLLAIVAFAIGLCFVGYLLYYVRFFMFGSRRIICFALLCGAIYMALRQDFMTFTLLWTAANFAATFLVIFLHSRRIKATKSIT